MEELQVIETTSGRQFKPWVDADKLQEIVSDPASVTAITSEIASGKQAIAAAINAKGGEASATESFTELAQDIQDTPTSGVLSGGIVQSEPFKFLDYACRQGAYPFTEIDDDSVTIINRNYAFYKQTQLLKVRMSASMVINGESVFNSCSALQEVNMPNLITISGHSVFRGCSALQEINMPNLITISGESIFHSCSALQEVNMPNLITISGRYVFQFCSALQEVIMPNLTTISGSDVFYGCTALQEVIMPNLTTISGIRVFYGCAALRDVTLGTLTSIVEPFSTAIQNLRNITIGQDTNINLPFQLWAATNVIAEGQSGIDELNSNLYNNLLTKLYDHSNDGQTRTLRIGWLSRVTAENIAYANAKGWTLTT